MTARGPAPGDPDAVRAWALSEIERLAEIPPDDPRRPIADDLTEFWQQCLEDPWVDDPGEPQEADAT